MGHGHCLWSFFGQGHHNLSVGAQLGHKVLQLGAWGTCLVCPPPLPCAATDPTTQVVARCTEADQCMQSACMPVYTVEGWSITVKARSKLRQQDLVFPATAFSVAASL